MWKALSGQTAMEKAVKGIIGTLKERLREEKGVQVRLENTRILGWDVNGTEPWEESLTGSLSFFCTEENDLNKSCCFVFIAFKSKKDNEVLTFEFYCLLESVTS